jgi:hypothetical protein
MPVDEHQFFLLLLFNFRRLGTGEHVVERPEDEGERSSKLVGDGLREMKMVIIRLYRHEESAGK